MTAITFPIPPERGTEDYLCYLTQRRTLFAKRNSLIHLLYEQNYSVRSIAFELVKEGYQPISSARVYEIIKRMFRAGTLVKKHRYGQDK